MSGNRQLSVKLKQVHLGPVKRDLLLKDMAALVDSERVLLQAEAELAQVQLLAQAELQEDCMFQCFSEMDGPAMTQMKRLSSF